MHARTAPVCALMALLVVAGSADAFILSIDQVTGEPEIPWTQSASGTRTANGQPATLTWGIVADGTNVLGTSGSLGSSDLIASFNAQFGGSNAQSDLTQLPWFRFFEESFDRWESFSGVDYVYEPNDSGQSLGGSTFPGVLGVRADIRIGGVSVDGPSNTLAFNFVPTSGSDMVIDTDDVAFFGNSGGDFVRIRNTVAHEIGHGFGLEHVISTNSALLMEPTISTAFDGPQLDEVRAAHFFFGDFFEKSNGGLGNNTTGNATPLGALAVGGGLSIGTDADVAGQVIGADDTDFVSLSNGADTDFYSFSVSDATRVSAVLTPRGGVFNQSGEGGTPTTFNANARVDLDLAVIDENGITVLALTDAGGLGVAESLSEVLLPDAGTYFVRVRGDEDTVQLYDLVLTATAVTTPGDYDGDGLVTAADYSVWRGTAGSTVTAFTGADGNGDTLIDADDYAVWAAAFGSAPAPATSIVSVPEPSSATLLIAAASVACAGSRRRAS